jgi:4-amino-4-deoxy-L-arabinose transferase-like glycosyltransferase
VTAGTAGVLGVALATLLAFLPRLGEMHVHDAGEARPALIAREMRQSGNWLVPRLGGRADTATPPLLPWTIALVSPGRVSEGSLRLPSALAGAATAGVTGMIGARLAGPVAGVVAAAVFASSLAVFASARTGGPEMLLTLFAALALWSLVRWLQEGRRLDAAALGLWIGLGVLTRGPVALIPLLVAVAAVIALRRPPAQAAGHLGLALGVALAVVIAWLGAVALTTPDATDYLRGLQRRVTRDLGRLRPRPGGRVLEALGGGFLPWSTLLPGAVLVLVWTWRNPPARAGAGSRGRAPERIELWLPALWVAIVVALFAFGVYARGVSPLVAFPALALIVAWAWHSASPHGRWAMAIPLWALAFAVVLGGTWIRWQRLRFPIGDKPPIVFRPTLTVVTIAICAAIAAGAAVLLLRARRPASSALALATGTLTVLLVVETALRIDAVNRAAPAPLLAGRFARQLPPRARVAYLDGGLTPAIVFYLPHESVRLSGAGSLRRLAGKRRVRVLLVERDLADATSRHGLSMRRLDSVDVDGIVYVLAAVEED